MQTNIRLRWLFTVAIATVLPLAAQTPDPCGGDCAATPIACSAPVDGALTPGDCAQEGRSFDMYAWTPEGTGDAEVVVRAAGFTPRLLYAFPPGQFPCRLVREGTDACAPGDNSIRCFSVPYVGSGARLIQVTSVEEGASGSYTLELHCAPQRCDPTCQRGTIPCGGNAAGTLQADDCPTTRDERMQTWSHKVESRSRLRVSVEASAPVTLALHFNAFFGRTGCYELLTAAPCSAGTCIDAVVDGGDYHLAVSGSPGTTYRIDARCDPFDTCGECPPIGAMTCGEKKTAQVGPDACGTYTATESGGSLRRWQRWSLDVAEGGFFEVRTTATEGTANWSILNGNDCTPAAISAQEPCAGAASPGVSCGVVRLEAGQYLIEVSTAGNPSSLPPLEYTLEVVCLDLGPCGSCPGGTLQCGTSFQGAFGPADCALEDGSFVQALRLEVPPPEVSDVKLTVTGNGFAPRVSLVDRFCKPIAAGKPCEEGPPNTVCVSARLNPQSFLGKVYLLVSTDPSGPPFSDYQVLTECQPFTLCHPSCVRGAIAVGEERRGELSVQSCSADGTVLADAWTLELAEPTLLDVLVDAEGFAPKLSVRDATCAVVSFSNPLPGGYARAFRQLEPGSYTVVVESDPAAPGQGGTYRLRLRSRGCDPDTCPPTRDLACAPDGKVDGSLEAGDCADAEGFLYDSYRLEVPALRRFSLNSAMQSPPLFLIFDASCRRRVGFVPTPNSALSFYLEKGVYTVMVTQLTPAQGGAYSFGFSCSETAYCQENCVVGTLECGVPAQGSLTAEDCPERSNRVDTWRFEVPPGGWETWISITTPPGTTVFFSVYPESCEKEVNVAALCQRGPPGSPAWICGLDPGAYRLAVYVESFRVQQRPLDYEITLSRTGGCSAGAGYLPGDCVPDGRLDLTDAICLLGYLFQGEAFGLPCEDGPGLPGAGTFTILDWDGNERLALTDAIRLLGWLFQGGPPHPLGQDCVRLPGCADAPCVAGGG